MEAVILVGIQGSGKSTFFREHYFRTHVRINLDMLKTRRREAILVRACIEAKQPFVVDNTNGTVADRERYTVPAKEKGFRTLGFYFDTPLPVALRHNAARPPGQRIPEVGIRVARARLQKPQPGEFNALFLVAPGPSGSFLIEEWPGTP